VRILIDSHIVVWWSLFPERLGEDARELLIDPENSIYLSAASVWELGIKISKGNLSLPENYVERLIEDGFIELPINFRHCKRAKSLPRLHRDPFDHLLIGQAQSEGIPLMTKDRHIRGYNVQIIVP
jgi:PIN domain nuclease of toxin-antitoxin system